MDFFIWFVVLSEILLLEFPLGSVRFRASEELRLAEFEWGIELWIYPLVKCSGISQSVLGEGVMGEISSFTIKVPVEAVKRNKH